MKCPYCKGKKIIFIIATLLQLPLFVIVVVFRYIGEAFNQLCFWLCYLLAKMFEYAGRYQMALEWIKAAEKVK